MKDYSVIQLMDIVDSAGEEETVNILSGFSCPLNQEIEHFLHKNALEFAKKKMSMTHLVLDEEGRFVGYFTLTHKPINVQEGVLSRTLSKRMQRLIGGEVVFLECEENAKLMAFYQSATNRFRTYGERYSDSESDEGTKYLQMLRFL